MRDAFNGHILHLFLWSIRRLRQEIGAYSIIMQIKIGNHTHSLMTATYRAASWKCSVLMLLCVEQLRAFLHACMHTLNGHRKLISFPANYHYYLFSFFSLHFWGFKLNTVSHQSYFFGFGSCVSRWHASRESCTEFGQHFHQYIHDPHCNCKWCIKYRYKQPNTCDAITFRNSQRKSQKKSETKLILQWLSYISFW